MEIDTIAMRHVEVIDMQMHVHTFVDDSVSSVTQPVHAYIVRVDDSVLQSDAVSLRRVLTHGYSPMTGYWWSVPIRVAVAAAAVAAGIVIVVVVSVAFRLHWSSDRQHDSVLLLFQLDDLKSFERQ